MVSGGPPPPDKVAAAACLASQASTLAQATWPGYRHWASPSARQASAELQDRTRPDVVLAFRTGRRDQAHLTGLLDGQGAMDLRACEDADQSRRHHPTQAAGAATWLTAPPARDWRPMEPTLFRVVVRRRLRLLVLLTRTSAHSCASLMHRYGDRALSCGDRTKRHEAVRNVIWEDARRAGRMVGKREGRPSGPSRRCGPGGTATAVC